MKTHKQDYLDSNSVNQIPLNLEGHCRRVHAEAVVHAFILLVSVPAKLLGKLLETVKRGPTDISKSEFYNEISLR